MQKNEDKQFDATKLKELLRSSYDIAYVVHGELPTKERRDLVRQSLRVNLLAVARGGHINRATVIVDEGGATSEAFIDAYVTVFWTTSWYTTYQVTERDVFELRSGDIFSHLR